MLSPAIQTNRNFLFNVQMAVNIKRQKKTFLESLFKFFPQRMIIYNFPVLYGHKIPTFMGMQYKFKRGANDTRALPNIRIRIIASYKIFKCAFSTFLCCSLFYFYFLLLHAIFNKASGIRKRKASRREIKK